MSKKPANKQEKTRYKVLNWSAYNQSLKQRGSVTFWLDDQALSHWWHTQPNGKRGRDYAYSDVAIQTFLMLQAVYGMSLRQTEGFLNSLFALMGVNFTSPDYSSVSKRAKTVGINIPKPNGPVAHLVLDATGLKVFGEGEWKVRKHGKEKRRTWQKLHLGVDVSSQQILCAEMSLENVGDNQALPVLLRQLRRKIGKVSGDGAYDTKACYQEVQRKGATANFPPRSNVGLWKEGHPRNEAVRALQAGKLKEWKRETNYHKRSLAETAMWRYKSLTGDKLRLRNYNAQVGEAMARVAVLNKMTSLGMPVSKMIR
ncbi:IS5 family transposase [Shewanella chilikensis]|uniref:IS5 family transposase n=1 Tax=Shewanella chilikensis TaxID=558541 RepID=UPI0030076112